MKHFLSSESLDVCLLFSGAELCSVKNKNGVEFIWQADKDVWPRHAPVLFPIVGKLKDNFFIFKDQRYELGQHGFARDRHFQLISSGKDHATFELVSDEKSKTIFPFDFIFQIKYNLIGNTLTTEYKLLNFSENKLLFSVGAHPGFKCPLSNSEQFDDYYLEFESSHYQVTALNNGLRKSTKADLELKGKRLQLSKTLFDRDALVFENNQINSISLKSDKSSHNITMECKNWPYFGIWAKKGSEEFICLEPWYGIADRENSTQDLEQKDGIISLDAKKEFACSFSVSFL
ncbi:hypothetical protein CNR22_09845 [Sphingobacteriaceae bacterium]|nr:hypothetical protein CNR22_09845 [Sphingobacteriaceae bacterium]